jgi:mannose-6-phosphate isomerase class I
MSTRTHRRSSYDLEPVVQLPGDHPVWTGRGALDELLRTATHPVTVVDCYPGVDVAGLVTSFTRSGVRVVDVEQHAGLDADDLAVLLHDDLTEDRVFGVLNPRPVTDFFDPVKLASLAEDLASTTGRTVVVGWGAALVAPAGAHIVLADLARWEIQQRFRRGAGNWRADNSGSPQLSKFKRGYFVEWRAADRHKLDLLRRADHLLDTTGETVKLITGDTLRAGLRHTATRPFRVVPYVDPGPWGGTWMVENLGLEQPADTNYAWCFDCVPEENSLLLGVSGERIEVPSLDVVLQHPVELLGQDVVTRFGAEFPIRFDLLDTVGGGNLSLQVHPSRDYIRSAFGMSYTQDESYYLLDADEGATVYLGLREDTDVDEMSDALRRAQDGDAPFDAERFVNVFPARKHDHFLIPAGTVHCSGAGSMVLEISATPYIFTFKLWDWGRLGLDGRPRPIHLEHGTRNIVPERRTKWVRENLVNRVEPVSSGEGWRSERTGLHELEFIETRRHWFSAPVEHDTAGTVHVLNLVEGDRVVVESPDGAFDDVTIHYAETFIVPAAVGRFRIRPDGEAATYATVAASVRPRHEANTSGTTSP